MKLVAANVYLKEPKNQLFIIMPINQNNQLIKCEQKKIEIILG